MKKYWEILREYKISLLISPFLVLITVLCETIQPTFMAQIIDDGVMQRDLSVVTQTGLYMVLISIAGLCISVINIYISSKTSIGFGTDLRSELFDKIQQLSFNDIDHFSSASLVTRLTNDISRIQQIVLMSMRLLLRAPMMLIMAVFFVVRINLELAMVLLAAIPVLSLSIFVILRKGFPLFMKVQQQLDRLNGVVRENLINIRVVKSFVREDFETKKFVKSSEELRDLVVRASNIVVAMFPVMQLVMNVSIVAILWIGGYKVIGGELKVGELISFVNYVMQVLMSLMMLSMIIMTFARASASSERIVEVLDTKPSLANTPEGLSDKNRIQKGEVSFRNVSFRYAGGEEDVLRNVSFDVRQGETIAVVGATGSAKSSMVQLIPRLYDVTGGELLIDGVNVKDYHLDELHAHIGMVLQKNELFTGTILDNLKWGKQNATMEEVEEATRAAEAHDFILSFQDGYDTQLGRGGVNVSGGQKQRLCIARALLLKPKILILDDSTSAVDSETELKIRRNLNALLSDTTVFIITQRVNTMQSADRVIVLEDGEVNAIGTPANLLETSDVYQEIYHSQQMTLP
ncbi:ATP-binding cassette subfamily B multidrug efflux pump [Parabacteroides sp. PF5-5]|uniref:ABC transporter ATP-binding protein n=1 Tax=unclassified Parabacteroides TaxID=2649774 RepID=UPI002474D7CD|nr:MULTISPECIES: ABC transporter ATP-binding protein [unclassified Parabacteroides]MDH6305805.1 ATP-binding cassette subfamily B multidrug efflux pump [Parabacteroides sp. PH5-39]MDH6317758.1 ATP-binding cassette subfamily B multidrug efflux pump [Parabacteroides sp. PF5-13]MDH6320589.1 ATP-binding cassette subfamily B multidrug efflux pump [Parabacteroides sp. PH5-13]MDH6324248.1 ATP-binding cassette subfamily B multidrug efflux pump [Parabacteroides sp. PH5-8]MDH6328943.1 ATP-binding cassett